MNAQGVYIDSIHLMRGIAALLVVFEHVVGRQPYPVFNRMFWFLDGMGQVGVAAFFVISGVVLPLSLGVGFNWSRLPNFFLRRIVRIEPTFLCAALAASLLVMAMSALAPAGAFWHPTWKQLALHAFYLIPFSNEEWILPVFWTLAVEFQYYVLIGFLFPLVVAAGKRSPHSALTMCASFALLAYASPLAPNVQLLKYSPCFAIGMIVAMRMMYGLSRPGIATAFVIIAAVAWHSGLGNGTLVGCFSAALIASFWVAPVNRDAIWIMPLWWLGTVSYSLYVTHQALAFAGENLARLILRVDSGLIGQTLANMVPIGIIAAAMLVSMLFYKWIEKPSFVFSKRLRKRAVMVPCSPQEVGELCPKQ